MEDRLKRAPYQKFRRDRQPAISRLAKPKEVDFKACLAKRIPDSDAFEVWFRNHEPGVLHKGTNREIGVYGDDKDI